MRNPNKNNAVAAKDSPKMSNTPAIKGGKPSFNRKPPITPNTVMNKIGLNTIDLMASRINVARLGLAAIDPPST